MILLKGRITEITIKQIDTKASIGENVYRYELEKMLLYLTSQVTITSLNR